MHVSPAEALDRIVDRYHQVADRCDAVLVVGTDYTDVGTPTEFAFNARIAANLGSPVLLVLNGVGRTPEELQTMASMAAGELRAQHGTLFAVVANRCDPAQLAADTAAIAGVGVPAYALPEDPLLNAPSVADLMRACDGTLVSGDQALLGRESTGLVVAAMTMPNVLDRLFEGCVVVTPGDRPEVVLGVLTAARLGQLPADVGHRAQRRAAAARAGQPADRGLGATMPIIATDLGTHATTTALNDVRGRLTKQSARKVVSAMSLFAEHVDGEALLDRLEVARTDVVTPLMFEHQLIDRARRRPAAHRAARGRRRPHPARGRHRAAPRQSPT